MYTEVKDMSKTQKKHVIDHFMGQFDAGAGEVHETYIEIIKYGYRNTYRWDVIAFNFETGRAKYGSYNGQRC